MEQHRAPVALRSAAVASCRGGACDAVSWRRGEERARLVRAGEVPFTRFEEFSNFTNMRLSFAMVAEACDLLQPERSRDNEGRGLAIKVTREHVRRGGIQPAQSAHVCTLDWIPVIAHLLTLARQNEKRGSDPKAGLTSLLRTDRRWPRPHHSSLNGTFRRHLAAVACRSTPATGPAFVHPSSIPGPPAPVEVPWC